MFSLQMEMDKRRIDSEVDMRLIDADKLLDDYSVFGMANISREDIRDELYDLIDNQPTAYDIDKVVEELKKEIVWVDQWGKRYCSQQNAIEIVKQGVR